MPTKKNKLITFKVISYAKNTVLIEWAEAGETQRGYIPLEFLPSSETISEELLEASVPYGIPWAEVITIDASSLPARLQNALRNAGLWTYADIEKNPQALLGAIQAAYNVDFTTLLATARNFNKGV